MHADDYSGFNELYRGGKVNEVACMAHIRRKIVDVFRSEGSVIAEEAIRRIAMLHAVDEEARGQPPEDRVLKRRERAKSILDDLENSLAAQLPKISGEFELELFLFRRNRLNR